MRFNTVAVLSIAILSTMLATACAPNIPRTLEEFQSAAAKKNRVIRKTEVFEVSRPFGEVFDEVKRRSAECMTLTIQSTQKGLIWDTKGHYSYSAITRKTGANSGIMALVEGGKEYKGDTMPKENVWYEFTAEMKAIGGGKTRVTMNGIFWDVEPYNAVKAYAEGRKYRYCPPHFY